jgi:hypothetical protein
MVRQFKRKWKENDGNLPAQERATEAFVEPFLKARQTGERDRWPAIVAALSKEIGVSTEELNRKYLKTQQLRPRPQSAFSAEAASTARSGASTNASRRLLNAQERAERFILGVLLSEPDRWRNVQEVVHVEDFTDDARRRLGETYWQHQRDEGELVLNEFLSGLTDSSLVELAVELVDELSELSDLEGTLTDSVLHLAEVRKRREEQKHMSQLRRTDAQLGEQDEVSALRKIQEASRTPNLRRVGS